MSNFHLTINVMDRIMSTSIILSDRNSNANYVDIMVFEPSASFPPSAVGGGGIDDMAVDCWWRHLQTGGLKMKLKGKTGKTTSKYKQNPFDIFTFNKNSILNFRKQTTCNVAFLCFQLWWQNFTERLLDWSVYLLQFANFTNKPLFIAG